MQTSNLNWSNSFLDLAIQRMNRDFLKSRLTEIEDNRSHLMKMLQSPFAVRLLRDVKDQLLSLHVLVTAIDERINRMRRAARYAKTIGLFFFEEEVSKLRKCLGDIFNVCGGTPNFEAWMAMDEAVLSLEIKASEMRVAQNSYYFIRHSKRQSKRRSPSRSRSRSRSGHQS